MYVYIYIYVHIPYVVFMWLMKQHTCHWETKITVTMVIPKVGCYPITITMISDTLCNIQKTLESRKSQCLYGKTHDFYDHLYHSYFRLPEGIFMFCLVIFVDMLFTIPIIPLNSKSNLSILTNRG